MITGAFFLFKHDQVVFLEIPSGEGFEILQCGTTLLPDYPSLSRFIVSKFAYRGRIFTIAVDKVEFEIRGNKKFLAYTEFQDLKIRSLFMHLDYKDVEDCRLTKYNPSFFSNTRQVLSNNIRFCIKNCSLSKINVPVSIIADRNGSGEPEAFQLPTIISASDSMLITFDACFDEIQEPTLQVDNLHVMALELEQFDRKCQGILNSIEIPSDIGANIVCDSASEVRELRKYLVRDLDDKSLTFYISESEMPVYFPLDSVVPESNGSLQFDYIKYSDFIIDLCQFSNYEWYGFHHYKLYSSLKSQAEKYFNNTWVEGRSDEVNLAYGIRVKDYLDFGSSGLMNISSFIVQIQTHINSLERHKKRIMDFDLLGSGVEVLEIGNQFNRYELNRLSRCEKFWMILCMCRNCSTSSSRDNEYSSGYEFLINRILRSFSNQDKINGVTVADTDWVLDKIAGGSIFEKYESNGVVVDLVDTNSGSIYCLLDLLIQGDDNKDFHRVLYDLWVQSSYNPYRNITDTTSISNSEFDTLWTEQLSFWESKGFPYTGNWYYTSGDNVGALVGINEYRPILIDYVSKRMFGFYMDSFEFHWSNESSDFINPTNSPLRKGIKWTYDGTLLSKKSARLKGLSPHIGKRNTIMKAFTGIYSDWLNYKLGVVSNLNEAFNEVNPEQESGLYHMFQPVSVAWLNQDSEIEFPINIKHINSPTNPNYFLNFLPIFYLRYLDRTGDREDFIHGASIALDVIMLACPLGEITNLRHLYRMGRLAGSSVIRSAVAARIKIGISYIEIPLTMIDTWHSYFSSCAQGSGSQNMTCHNLGVFLTYLQLAVSGTQKGIEWNLRESAFNLLDSDLEEMISEWSEVGNLISLLEEISNFDQEALEIKSSYQSLYPNIHSRLSNNQPTNGETDFFNSKRIALFHFHFNNREALQKLNNQPELIDWWAKVEYLKVSQGNIDFLEMFKQVHEDLSSGLYSASLLNPLMEKYDNIRRVREELAYALFINGYNRQLPGEFSSKLSDGQTICITKTLVAGVNRPVISALELAFSFKISRLRRLFNDSSVELIMQYLISRVDFKYRVGLDLTDLIIVGDDGISALLNELIKVTRENVNSKRGIRGVYLLDPSGEDEHSIIYIIFNGVKQNYGIRIQTDCNGDTTLRIINNSFREEFTERAPTCNLELDDGLMGIDYGNSNAICKYPETDINMEVEITMSGRISEDFKRAIEKFNLIYLEIFPDFTGNRFSYNDCFSIEIEGVLYTLHYCDLFNPLLGTCNIQLIREMYHNPLNGEGYIFTSPKNDYLIFNRLEEYQ